MKISILAALFSCWFIIHSQCSWSHAQMKGAEEGISLEEAKGRARDELKRRGYPVEEMKVTADEKNTAWQELVSREPSIMEREIVKRLNLEEKYFWAVYYAPKKMMLGGDAWVFVEANNGEIIGVILGE